MELRVEATCELALVSTAQVMVAHLEKVETLTFAAGMPGQNPEWITP